MTTHRSPIEGRHLRARARRFAAGLAVAAAAAAALLAGSAANPAAAAVEPVPCDALSIAVDAAPGAVRSCEAGQVMLSNGEGAPIPLSVEALVAAEEASWQIVLSYVIRGRAYLPPRKVTTVLESYGWFDDSRNWSEIAAVGAFDTVRFEARPDGSGGYWQCAGFLRYSGRVPRSFGGHRRALLGAYCTDQTAPVSPDQLRGVLQALRF